MALIALRKLNLQTRMRSNPLGLHVWFLVRPFVYFHTVCVRTAKALARLRGCLCDKYYNLMCWLINHFLVLSLSEDILSPLMLCYDSNNMVRLLLANLSVFVFPLYFLLPLLSPHRTLLSLNASSKTTSWRTFTLFYWIKYSILFYVYEW